MLRSSLNTSIGARASRARATASLVRVTLSAALLVGIASPPPATAAEPTSWLDYTIIAEDRLTIGPNLNLAGNFAVTGAGGSLEIGLNTFHLDGDPTPVMAADTIHLGAQASIVDAYTNQIAGNSTGEVRGQIFPRTFPLTIARPSFPVGQACDSCATSEGDVAVSSGANLTLNPGCYGELLARSDSTVFLRPGSYTFKEWDIRKFAAVMAEGPVQIHIRRKLKTEESVFLGATSGNVSDYQVWIAAETSCSAGSNPIKSTLGKFTVASGTFVAPEDDDFNLNKGVVLIGTVLAKRVDVRGDHAARPPTPTPTQSPTPTPSPSVTPTPSPSPNVPTPTPTEPFHPPTPSPSPSPSPKPTPTSKPTSTPMACFISPKPPGCG